MNCFQELNKRIDELSKTIPEKCTRCSRFGHNSTECKTPFCNKCKSMGHFTANCRSNRGKTEPNRQNKDIIKTVMI